ncbi:MAG: YjgP/YjgQ family permease [Caldiserica bacterium]|nr:YjgP/YjgQ family permease [Caldisericota bacterium]
MKKLYKRLSCNFFRVLLGILLLFTLVYLVADFLSQVPEFLKEKSPPIFILLYYLSLIPSSIIQVSPLSMVVTLWLTVGEMAENRELLTLETSGISFKAVALPIVIVGFLFASLLEIANLNLVPSAQIYAYRLWKGKIQGEKDAWEMKEKKIGYQDARGRVIYIASLSAREGKLEEIEILSPDDSSRLEAKVGWWQGNYWELEGVIRRNTLTGEITRQAKMKEKSIPPPISLWKLDKPDTLKNLSELKKLSFLKQPYYYTTHIWHRFLFPWGGFILLVFSLIVLAHFVYISLGLRMLITFVELLVYYGSYYLLFSLMERGSFPAPFGFFVFLGFWAILGVFLLLKK